ncbi:hypothetical protein F4775DRAFT_600706 [Biscogniauxia sp. FL1348]|nr:hypothetical protein F4775DRAFT_600706 [Biscogniauxia sp. FL1348]
MMSCYSYCHHVRLNGSRTLLDHNKNTIPGRTFYYCSIHRVYHCIQQKSHPHRRRLQQPLCGECAWLFFRFPREAEKRPASDLPGCDVSAPVDVATPRTQSLSASAQDELDRLYGSVSGRSVGGACGSDESELSGFETALDDITRYISRGWAVSSPPGGRSSPATTYSSSASSSSDRTSSGTWSPGRDSVVVVRQDSDGDVDMVDPSSSEPEAKGEAAVVMVHVPIRDRKSVLESIPYEDPSVFDVRPLGFHVKYPELFMFRYTDFAGQTAVQPTAGRDIIRAYFAPLDHHHHYYYSAPYPSSSSPPFHPSPPWSCTTTSTSTRATAREEMAAADSLLRTAREWCCWAQGFQMLEPEVRWLLTLVFDFANLMVARQTLGAYGAESPLFWRARYVLHGLICAAEDLAELYDIPNLDVPRLDWFAEA